MSLLLTFVLALTCSTAAFASEPISLTTSVREIQHGSVHIRIEDSADFYIVTATYEDHTEIAVKNRNINVITATILDENGSCMQAATLNASIPTTIMTASADYQHTFSNYEYDIDDSGTYDVWTCRRKDDYKTRTYIDNTTTAERLERWRDDVEDINDLEFDLILEVGVGVAEVAIAGAASAGLAAGLAFLEGSISAELVLFDLIDTWDHADEIFDKL